MRQRADKAPCRPCLRPAPQVKKIVERAYRRAKDLLTTNMDVLHKVAAVLIEKENLDGEEFQKVRRGCRVCGG